MPLSCKENASGGVATKQTEFMTYPAKHISISINKPMDEVYTYTSKPENLRNWLAFIESVSKDGDNWKAKTTAGEATVLWSRQNEYGILDHEMIFANGEHVKNALRIIPNNEGSEVIFTLLRLPGKTDEQYEEDAALVAADLKILKEIMEK